MTFVRVGSFLAIVLSSGSAETPPSSIVPDVLLASAIQAAIDSGDRLRAGPTVPPQWSSSLKYTGDVGGLALKDGLGHFHYDALGQRHRETYTSKINLFRPNGTVTLDTIVSNVTYGARMNLTFGEGTDGVCDGFDTPYYDIFSFLTYAQKNGSDIVDGNPCDVWILPIPSYNMIQRACLGDHGLPFEFARITTGSGKFSGTTSYLFSEFKVGDPGSKAFENTQACAGNYPTKPCPNATTERMYTYRVQGPEEPRDLTNRDTGDVLGDVSFICTQGAGADYRDKVVTLWAVDVSTGFGQYSLCNFDGKTNVCTGPPAPRLPVGRRSSQVAGGGPLQGQCSSNDDVGSQYSFHEEGHCAPGYVPGDASGCTWGNERPVRTISAQCVLEERGLLQTCTEEIGHAPFVKSAAIWEAAFNSSEASMGGCPDVKLPNSAFCWDHPGCSSLHPEDKLCCPVATGVRLACCDQPGWANEAIV